MQLEFSQQLPPLAQALLVKIEAFARTEVMVKVEPRDVDPSDPNPDGPACRVDERSATIFIQDPLHFKPQGITHELLHIQRFWNEGVPQVLPKPPDDDRLKITSHIENTLEHLVIVPREAKLGFEPFAHWNQTVAANWASYPWPNMSHPWTRQKNCLLGWLTASNLVSDKAIREHVENCLRAEGLLEAAVDLQRKVGLTLKNKARAVSHVIKALNIPQTDVELVQLDILRKKRHAIPFPK
jgi:hypothetical protein